jgi:hypothetical protein
MMGIKRYSAGVMLALAACATTTSTPSIYYKTQAEADVALAAFDTDNPDCQLWTNWQKMCSRTGDGGATYCTKNADLKARPSVPFCAAPIWLQKNNQENETLSSLRFCKKTFIDENRVKCALYQNNRPFSYFSIHARINKWCREWRLKSNDKVVLNSDISMKYKEEFYCSKPDIPNWCVKAGGLGRISVDSPNFRTDENQIVVPEVIEVEKNFPVVGIYCEERK